LEVVYGILAVMFACFFALNIYFRVKVFKHYRVLMRNRVEFAAADIFSDARVESIVLRHPDLREHIVGYCRNMRFTMRMATVFVILVIILGFVLLRSR